MRIDAEVRGQLARRFEVLLPHLNERQQRLALATEARLLGHGGIRAVAEATGVSATTVRKGVDELESGEDPLPVGRARRAGGGRKRANEHDRELTTVLLRLVEPDERGDPMSPLRWTTKSLRHLAEELARQGHPVSAPTVGRLLRENGFSLQGTAKTLEGVQHPDRDAQFTYINERVKAHQDAGEPVISVDAKKKEQLGRLPAAGREWRPKGDPVQVEDHSFFTAGADLPLAVPVLTGLSRADLAAMTERVKHAQQARNERHRHRRRGGERLPGARGGVFQQKITDDERVLATVLYQRKLCTQDTLAELFQVSRRTIGDVVREVGPILTNDGFTPTTATTRYATAADLLASIPPPESLTTPPH